MNTLTGNLTLFGVFYIGDLWCPRRDSNSLTRGYDSRDRSNGGGKMNRSLTEGSRYAGVFCFTIVSVPFYIVIRRNPETQSATDVGYISCGVCSWVENKLYLLSFLQYLTQLTLPFRCGPSITWIFVFYSRVSDEEKWISLYTTLPHPTQAGNITPHALFHFSLVQDRFSRWCCGVAHFLV